MSKWIDFSLEERKAMLQGVVEARQIDESAAEKDWEVRVTRVIPSSGRSNLYSRSTLTTDYSEF